MKKERYTYGGHEFEVSTDKTPYGTEKQVYHQGNNIGLITPVGKTDIRADYAVGDATKSETAKFPAQRAGCYRRLLDFICFTHLKFHKIDRKFSFEITHTLPEQFLHDCIITAVEGGINYWAEIVTYQLNGDKVTSCWVRDYECDDDTPKELSVDVIADGIRKLLNGKAKLNRTTLNELRRAVAENDAGYVDAAVADAVAQVALFNEIVYG